jgi:WD40 repeat protein
VCLWSPAKGEDPLFSVSLPGEVTGLAWAPDDRRLAATGSEGDVRVFQIG